MAGFGLLLTVCLVLAGSSRVSADEPATAEPAATDLSQFYGFSGLEVYKIDGECSICGLLSSMGTANRT
ncbi:MAG UNVERIFIED_CONTAM: hypothetical protein LVR18_17075 [Planctomycetaceae bacterium]